MEVIKRPAVISKDAENANTRFNIRETYIYQERNIKYKITSNRLRILTRGHKEFPNMRIYKKANGWGERPQQDYIENKIRVMQQHRLKFVIPGKNPEYYFLEASKQALRNEIP